MKKNIKIIIIVTVILILGLWITKYNTDPNTPTNTETQSENIQTIVNEEFIMSVLRDLEYQKVKMTYPNANIIETPVSGKWAESNNIKSLVFDLDQDIIRYYSNNEREFVEKIEIVTNIIILDGNLRIGVAKSLIESRFGLKLEDSGMLEITNLEGLIKVKLLLRDEKLSQISMEVEYVD